MFHTLSDLNDFTSQWGSVVPGAIIEDLGTRQDFGTVNVSPKAADSWTNYLIYGGLALAVVVMLTGGRRR